MSLLNNLTLDFDFTLFYSGVTDGMKKHSVVIIKTLHGSSHQLRQVTIQYLQ